LGFIKVVIEGCTVTVIEVVSPFQNETWANGRLIWHCDLSSVI